MQVYTYSEARQRLSSVLDKAELSGKVLIRRKDGRTFALAPERTETSPLDVPSIKARVSTDELVSIVRKERGRTTASTRFLKGRQRPSRNT
jgi:antitoxin Phd